MCAHPPACASCALGEPAPRNDGEIPTPRTTGVGKAPLPSPRNEAGAHRRWPCLLCHPWPGRQPTRRHGRCSAWCGTAAMPGAEKLWNSFPAVLGGLQAPAGWGGSRGEPLDRDSTFWVLRGSCAWRVNRAAASARGGVARFQPVPR